MYIMKSIYQKFIDFKSRHQLSNERITKMITEYAYSSSTFARSFFKEKYGISESTFYKSRDYAVICCLVDEKTCQKLRNKSATNYSNNNKQGSSTASVAHFQELLVKRKEFLEGVSTSEIQDIANKYVEGVSVDKIAIAYDTGSFAIKYLLRKGIVMLIVDANTVRAMKALLGTSLNSILQEREKSKKALLNCIQKEIDFLRTQIECYPLYFRNVSDRPTLNSLNDKLSATIRMYHEALRL